MSTKSDLPRSVEGGGRTVTLRLMARADAEAVLAFARALPEHDLLFVNRDITQAKVVEAWIREIEAGGFVTVLAVDGASVLGCVTVVRDPLSWSAHVAELRLVVSAQARGGGLGTVLAQEGFATALRDGAAKVFARMTTDQTGAIAMFEGLGFAPEAMLRDHVKDRQGTAYDVLVLSHHVARFQSTLAAYGMPEAF